MRPLLLKGHERPLTMVRFNREGDILFTSAKDSSPTAWWASSGERIGTYKGHTGVVWGLDVTHGTDRVLTGSGDNSARLFEASTGKCLYTWSFPSPVRCVALAPGDRVAAMSNAKLMGQESAIHFMRLAEDATAIEEDRIMVIKDGLESTVIRMLFGPTGEWILSASEDGTVSKWDLETGTRLQSVKEHTAPITDMQFSKEAEQFITSSTDQSARLMDTRDLRHLKTYQTDRPVNSAAVSPLFDHVLLGGGQDASKVTTTADREGKFEARLYHKIYTSELGRIKGHFGPINTVAFSPDGRQYVSGGEDGFVRLHHFDQDYFDRKYD